MDHIANPRYVTVEEIESLYRRPRGTIYRLAKSDEWRRVNDGRYPALYRAADVAETFKRLATRRATRVDKSSRTEDSRS